MTTVLAALVRAAGMTVASWRAVLALWLVGMLLAWILISPLRAGIEQVYLHHPLGQELLTRFDTGSFVDFWHRADDPVGATASAVAGAVGAWLLLWSVLAAGILAQLADRRAHPSWLGGCARFGHRFAWLLVVTFVALAGLAWFNDLLSRWLTALLIGDDQGRSADWLGWGMSAKTLFMLGLLGLLLTTTRVARLRVVLLGERFVPLSWLRSLLSVVKHLPTMGLGRLLSLWPLALAVVLYRAAGDGLQDEGVVIPGLPLSWHWLLVFQAIQLGVAASLVYRMAVDVRLWAIVAPPSVAAQPPTVEPAQRAPSGAATGAPVIAVSLVAVLPAALLAHLALGPGGDPAPAQAPAAPRAEQLAAGQGAQGMLGPQDASRHAYRLDVQLDVPGRKLTAIERATFRNTTSVPVEALWMHLYANAFSNTHSTWMRPDGGKPILERGRAGTGGMEVRRVALADGTDLGAATSIEDSLLHVRLDEPIAPGDSCELIIEFETRFPHTIARMGQVGTHVDGMQWYPKFCAHDEKGWRNRPFYRMGEFYADFARFDVTFHYDSEVDGRPLQLEATGVPGDAVQDDATHMRRSFRAEGVHDFAFCADPVAQRLESSWRHPTSGDEVQIVYLCQPYALPKAQLVLDIVRSCLDHSAAWWFPYPYPRLVIDGLPHNLGGGMEYPMLFTVSQRFPSHMAWLDALTEEPAHVAAHEFAHQYWYGMLANDEVDEAWLDEGITTWATLDLIQAFWPDAGQTDFRTFLERKLLRDGLAGGVRGEWPLGAGRFSLQQAIGWRTSPFHDAPPGPAATEPTLLGFPVPDVHELRLPDMSADRAAWWRPAYRRAATARPISAPSRDFSDGYGGLVYRKTALMLDTLRRHVGDDTMRLLMKTYAQRFAFRHPTADDFLAVASEVTGGTHDAWLEQLVDTAATVDFGVSEVRSRASGQRVGYAPQSAPGDPLTWVGPEQPGGGGEDETAAEGPWESRFVVRQFGSLEAPVAWEARFEDGSSQRGEWDGVGSYHIVELVGPSKLREVIVDPDRLFALDLDVNNNGWRLHADHETVRILTGLSHFWTQNVLDLWLLAF